MKHKVTLKKRYITSLAALFMAGTFMATTSNASADTTSGSSADSTSQTEAVSYDQTASQSQINQSNVVVLSEDNPATQQNTQAGTAEYQDVPSVLYTGTTPDVINDANVTASSADDMKAADFNNEPTDQPTTLLGKIASDVNDKITDVTTGTAAKVVFPIGFSRKGSDAYSKLEDIQEPDRYDTSRAYGGLGEKYDPAASETFYNAAQDWWDNVADKQTLTIPSSSFPNETSTATFVANPGSKQTVIIGQGWTEHPDWVGVVSGVWYNMGYNVLMPSQRGQFSGDGDYIPFGYYDSQDWKNWVNVMDSMVGPDEEVIYYGQSMGAATALDAAADPQLPSNVKAVIADCSFSSLTSLGNSLYNGALNKINGPLGKLIVPIKLNSIPLIPFDKTMQNVDKINEAKQGFDLDDASPIDAVAKITIPSYFITTEDDDFIPDTESVALYNASVAPIKKLWVLDGAVGGHAHAEGAVEQYQQNIQGFLNEVDQANTASIQAA
ncbi:alpha/beta hydrolase [Companilactobacillus mishanensis]|uniref:Alpha/beta hydrolase n=1 Tax=Companilactobacillus mishanensis TaxID=2486008 RepID=A0ABW9P750_9LACO|nr:alpha/beta hydrolase [Companilactobacillus mishanensis]MQS45058.1 alpha/beta hydrolase [Companilactobacillus mishanensis]